MFHGRSPSGSQGDSSAAWDGAGDGDAAAGQGRDLVEQEADDGEDGRVHGRARGRGAHLRARQRDERRIVRL
eukprot:301849-Hanusia_phi.AAC.7